MTIAVIIPVLNEACGIGQTLSHTATLGFDELIVVDGGSSDQTCAVVESCAGRLPERGLAQARTSLADYPSSGSRGTRASSTPV